MVNFSITPPLFDDEVICGANLPKNHLEIRGMKIRLLSMSGISGDALRCVPRCPPSGLSYNTMTIIPQRRWYIISDTKEGNQRLLGISSNVHYQSKADAAG